MNLKVLLILVLLSAQVFAQHFQPREIKPKEGEQPEDDEEAFPTPGEDQPEERVDVVREQQKQHDAAEPDHRDHAGNRHAGAYPGKKPQPYFRDDG